MTPVDWAARFAALANLDGNEWEEEYDRLREAWLAAYSGAFVEIAIARGWRREDAITWPIGIGDEALIEAYQHDWCPHCSAEADVIGCEEPP
jgi:hypothetical protein